MKVICKFYFTFVFSITVDPLYSHPLYKHSLFLVTPLLGPDFLYNKIPLYSHKVMDGSSLLLPADPANHFFSGRTEKENLGFLTSSVSKSAFNNHFGSLTYFWILERT